MFRVRVRIWALIRISFSARFRLRLGLGSGQVVVLKARPAMDAAVMSFHLSLSPTSISNSVLPCDNAIQ